MIKAEELMIGDWVLDGTQDAQVTGITCDGIIETTANANSNIELLEPIPITPEILEKNGWERRPTGYVFHIDGGKSYDNTLWYIFNDNTFVVEIEEFSIKYIHELQHALKLCGITKKIEL